MLSLGLSHSLSLSEKEMNISLFPLLDHCICYFYWFCYYSIIEEVRQLSSIVCCILMDFWKVFVFVPKDCLFQRLCDIGILNSLIMAVMKLYETIICRIALRDFLISSGAQLEWLWVVPCRQSCLLVHRLKHIVPKEYPTHYKMLKLLD